jgi:hypothetical protein
MTPADKYLSKMKSALEANEMTSKADNALSALDKIEKFHYNHDMAEMCDTLRTYITSTAGQGGELREITEEEITAMFDPAPVFKESFHWIVGWLQDKFPNGVKIK